MNLVVGGILLLCFNLCVFVVSAVWRTVTTFSSGSITTSGPLLITEPPSSESSGGATDRSARVEVSTKNVMIVVVTIIKSPPYYRQFTWIKNMMSHHMYNSTLISCQILVYWVGLSLTDIIAIFLQLKWLVCVVVHQTYCPCWSTGLCCSYCVQTSQQK